VPHAAPKSSLLNRVRRLFADKRALAATAAPASAAPRRPAQPAAPDPTVSIAGARFSLVGLSELREQLGERWPELSARVHDLAQAVIQRHLGRGDVYDAHGEDSYVILFTQLTQLQAEFKCRVIAKEIAGKLLGADWVGRTTDGIVFELPESALHAPSFDRALNAAIAAGRRIAAADVALPPPGAVASVRLDETTDAVTAGASHGDDPAAAVSASAQMLKRIERERPVAYWPVWDFGAEALLRFRYKSVKLATDAGFSDQAKADVAALSQALFDIGQLLQTGRRLPVIVPVGFQTVTREGWRAQIMRMLREADAPLRKLVTLEVTVPAGETDWLPAVERASASLPDTPGVAVPLHASAIPARASDVVKRLTLALPDGFVANKRGIDLLGAFAQKSERVGMACGVMGLKTRAAALAATAAGYRQLSGPAIHTEVAQLGQAVHFDLRTLYRDLLPRAG
jgi:hypothetical protein